MGDTAERASELVEQLRGVGVAGVTVAWCDNNGIPRSRTVPVASLPQVAETGIGVSTVFAVFDTNDGIQYGAPGRETPSGDVRLVPDLDRLTPLAGQPGMAWAPGTQVDVDGSPWPWDQRSLLAATVDGLAERGYTALVGYEMEFAVSAPSPDGAVVPAYRGPAYSPHGLLEIDAFATDLLRDAEANGLRIGQFHAEYGPGQVELSLGATDPVRAADEQLLARQTVLAAAARHGLRISFAPLPSLQLGGQRLARPQLAVARRRQPARRRPRGARHGRQRLHRGPPARPARRSPPSPRPRSAPWRGCGRASSRAPTASGASRTARPRSATSSGSPLLGADHANVELKVSDASANPYLALTALLTSGVAGVEENLVPPSPIAADPGTWKKKERAAAGVEKLPTTQADQEAALLACPRITEALGAERLGAFLAVRRADAAWAAEREPEDVLAAWRWRY